MESQDKKQTQKLKNYYIITIGDSNAGKTCLVSYYVNGRSVIGEPSPTVGTDFFSKKEKINKAVKSFTYYDTAGSERFRNMATTYYKKVEGVLLVFDLTNESSFLHVSDWVDSLCKYKKREDFVLVLVGNKYDLIEDRENFSIKKYKDAAQKFEAEFYLTSALTGEGVEKCFKDLLKKIVEMKPDPNDLGISIEGEHKKKKNC